MKNNNHIIKMSDFNVTVDIKHSYYESLNTGSVAIPHTLIENSVALLLL